MTRFVSANLGPRPTLGGRFTKLSVATLSILHRAGFALGITSKMRPPMGRVGRSPGWSPVPAQETCS